MKTIHYFLFGLASALGLVAVAWVAFFARHYTYQGVLIDPPLKVADFQLTGQDGKPVHLSDLRRNHSDLGRGGAERGTQGKATLIFFGYTHCTDICPATMADYKKIKAQLGSQANDVLFVFISVDPERDTPEVVSQYVSNFDPSFVGLTGSQAELEPVWKIFGVYVEKGIPNSMGDYEFSHSSRVYALDRNGDLRLTYEFGADPQAITQDVEHLLKEK